ncbi:hypothetical protein FN846DRAFT_967601, partial [Sphaerosporella brunnea]
MSCYHPGHADESEILNCPVARLRSYIFSATIEADAYTVGSNEQLGHVDLFFKDFALVVQGHTWAAVTMKDGDGSHFGITVANLFKSSEVLERCKALEKDGRILRTPGDMSDDAELFIGDYSVHGVQDCMDPSTQVEVLEHCPSDIGVDSDVAGTKPTPPKPKPKRKRATTVKTDLCDNYNLEVIGDRKSAICNGCFFRGHIGASAKVCPMAIVEEALKRSQTGSGWRVEIDKYNANHRRLIQMLGVFQE